VENWFQALTQIAPQTVCFVSLLWQKYLQRLGIKPVAVGGHSLGELTAFQAADCYDEKTLLCFAALRGQVMTESSSTTGTMASLACSRSQAEDLLRGVAGYVTIANLNSPSQTVISGEVDSVLAVLERALVRGIQGKKLPVANAFHSQMVAAAAEKLRQTCSFAEYPTPKLWLVSSKTGQQVSQVISLSEHFADQITAQVDFISLYQQIARQCDFLLEVGPGKVLSGLTAEITEFPLCLPLESQVGNTRDLNTAIAAIFVQGTGINWNFFYENRLIRPFIPASERLFIDNPCERSFDFEPEELDQIIPFPLQTTSKSASLENLPALSTEEISDLLSHYFSQRSSFLAELIRADLENLSFL
jgi:acyl transferase domain-containing protein